MMNLGAFEVLLIAVVALILFGPQRLSEIARTVGKALREFRRATSELSEEIASGIDFGEKELEKPRDLRPGPRG